MPRVFLFWTQASRLTSGSKHTASARRFTHTGRTQPRVQHLATSGPMGSGGAELAAILAMLFRTSGCPAESCLCRAEIWYGVDLPLTVAQSRVDRRSYQTPSTSRDDSQTKSGTTSKVRLLDHLTGSEKHDREEGCHCWIRVAQQTGDEGGSQCLCTRTRGCPRRHGHEYTA